MSDNLVARTQDVRAALDRVTDPELDESVVELGFITGITVEQHGDVLVNFRLPTYWCAANFSYLMASDMRDAVVALPWVTAARVVLDEHMFVEAINDGIAENKDFQEAFPTEAQMDLSAIRLNFGLKSFERRQEVLLRHLRGQGFTPDTILALDISGLSRLTLDPEGIMARTRYLERRGLVGGLPRAFVARDGGLISPDMLAVYLRNIRRVGLNAEFNGALCRGLLAARYNTSSPLPAEPELIDFIKQATASQ
ncbi:MAG: iron-sulfur cluster assembly protein [Acidocella sp.]|nr:iron-sulfur cluster assembly protein [Acidocella sp.]